MAGRTKKQIAGGQRRTLQAIVTKLRDVAYEWDGVDEFNVGALDDLIQEVETVSGQLSDDE